MKIRVWTALACSVLLESIRRKDLWVVAILGFLIVASAGALGMFGLEGLESFAKDLATTVVGAFSTILACLISCRILPDEVRNRTLYPLIARPISRWDLMVGKLVGAIWTTWIAFGMLCVLTGLSLVMFNVHFEWIMLQYVLCKALGLALICSLGLTLSVYMTPSAAATMCCILAFASPMLVRALTMAYDASNASLKPLFQALNLLLPQVGLFDLGSRAANSGWAPVPIWVVGSLFAYAVLYSLGSVLLGWLKFRNQAV